MTLITYKTIETLLEYAAKFDWSYTFPSPAEKTLRRRPNLMQLTG